MKHMSILAGILLVLGTAFAQACNLFLCCNQPTAVQPMRNNRSVRAVFEDASLFGEATRPLPGPQQQSFEPIHAGSRAFVQAFSGKVDFVDSRSVQAHAQRLDSIIAAVPEVSYLSLATPQQPVATRAQAQPRSLASHNSEPARVQSQQASKPTGRMSAPAGSAGDDHKQHLGNNQRHISRSVSHASIPSCSSIEVMDYDDQKEALPLPALNQRKRYPITRCHSAPSMLEGLGKLNQHDWQLCWRYEGVLQGLRADSLAQPSMLNRKDMDKPVRIKSFANHKRHVSTSAAGRSVSGSSIASRRNSADVSAHKNQALKKEESAAHSAAAPGKRDSL